MILKGKVCEFHVTRHKRRRDRSLFIYKHLTLTTSVKEGYKLSLVFLEIEGQY